MRVVYDGWSLLHEPGSPPALHLSELLACLPAEVDPFLVLPGELPPVVELPSSVRIHIHPHPAGEFNRLRWEQRTLPYLARRLKASLVHLVTYSTALFGGPPTVLSPAVTLSSARPAGSGMSGRMRKALGHGALGQVKALLWPADFPHPRSAPPLVHLPPLVPPDFNPADPPDGGQLTALGLPEFYLLCHDPMTLEKTHLILEIWSRAAGSIGALYPLVLAGVQEPGLRAFILERARQAGLDHSLVILADLPTQALPHMYAGCAGLLHLGTVSPWWEPLRYALACGKPVVGIESPQADAILGPAGYLLPQNDTRRLAAALLSVVVNEDVAQELSQAALERAIGWKMEAFTPALLRAYQTLGNH